MHVVSYFDCFTKRAKDSRKWDKPVIHKTPTPFELILDIAKVKASPYGREPEMSKSCRLLIVFAFTMCMRPSEYLKSKDSAIQSVRFMDLCLFDKQHKGRRCHWGM